MSFNIRVTGVSNGKKLTQMQTGVIFHLAAANTPPDAVGTTWIDVKFHCGSPDCGAAVVTAWRPYWHQVGEWTVHPDGVYSLDEEGSNR